MKAFVTGGTGFIGSHLVDDLIDNKQFDEIRCLVRNREKWLTGKQYTKVNGDLFTITRLRNALEGIDTLFHIAAIVKARTKDEFQKANVDATENLIRIARKSGVKKIVVLSSLAAAGPSSGEPISEDAPMNPVSMYGESKKEMEKMIHRIHTPELSITILRPPAVYGPREDQIYTFFKLMNKRICPIVGNGLKPEISMIYVADLIRALSLAEQKQTPGVHTYFVSGPEIYNWNQIKEVTSKILGKRPVPLYIRPGLVKKIAGAVESAASMFGTYPVLNREKANEMVLEWTCSNKKAADELQYQPSVSLEEGISRTIHWYKKHHWL
jgi:dihydroflavonol-4-reductase